MLESIKRLFANWHRISRERVPRWVRGKLYKQKYVQDRGREYKKIVVKKERKFTYWFGVDHDNGGELLNEGIKHWKKHKFYYRKLKKPNK